MNVVIKEYKPSENLKPYIEFYWSGSFNTMNAGLLSQRVVPNGYVELILHIDDDHCELISSDGFSSTPDYILIGLYTKPYEVRFQRNVNVFGIRFKPEGIYHIFGVPASELKEEYADMESVAGKNFREYSERLREKKNIADMINFSENYLSNKKEKCGINLYYLNRAADIIRRSNGLITINRLAEEVYISARQLEREFKKILGLTPKSYMRIARLNEVNRIIKSGRKADLTELSYTCGYADQAHFIRDYKNFTGESPASLIRESHKYIINPEKAEGV